MPERYCEHCGTSDHHIAIHKHHVKSRGAGGPEIPENEIQLCAMCHTKVHSGHIKRSILIAIIAKRLEVAVESIYNTLGWIFDGKTLEEIRGIDLPGLENPYMGKSLEEVLSDYFMEVEKETGSIWNRAALLTTMQECYGLKPNAIASFTGNSASTCRKMIKTFSVFGDPDTRITYLSFRHHQEASYSTDPYRWIAEAADNEMSTRQLREAIKADGLGPVAVKEQRMAKAERITMMISEILAIEDEVSRWLTEQCEIVLKTRPYGSLKSTSGATIN